MGSIYTKKVTLPSRGYLNPEIPDGEVIIRCITIADQKFMSGSNLGGDTMVLELLKRCVESPKEFDPSKLTSVDTFYLLVELRNLSYGGKYSFTTKCPECGKKMDVHIDIADLVVDYLDPDYEDNMNVVLPHKGDTVYTKILTNEDEREIDKESKRIAKKFKDAGDPGITVRLARSIVKIELDKPDDLLGNIIDNPIDIQKYVEGLTDLDATAISATLTPTYGIQTSIETKCQECREDVEVSLRFTPQFFRPKYDITRK